LTFRTPHENRNQVDDGSRSDETSRTARADAAKSRDARVEFAQAAHPLAMTAEICERLERIEAAIPASGPENASMSVPSDPRDDS